MTKSNERRRVVVHISCHVQQSQGETGYCGEFSYIRERGEKHCAGSRPQTAYHIIQDSKMQTNANPYHFSFEIAGPMAMFMRPDTGSTPGSYPIPTGSAIKAMAESIALVEGAWFQPTSIEVCRPIVYAQYATNYGGPNRKHEQIKKNTSFQLVARVLVDVCYKVYGQCVKTDWHDGHDPARKLHEMLDRRLAGGQSRFPPCLGWKEFAPDYFGTLRPTTVRQVNINDSVEGYLLQVWSAPQSGVWKPRFAQVEIVEGVCDLKEAWNHAS